MLGELLNLGKRGGRGGRREVIDGRFRGGKGGWVKMVQGKESHLLHCHKADLGRVWRRGHGHLLQIHVRRLADDAEQVGQHVYLDCGKSARARVCVCTHICE